MKLRKKLIMSAVALAACAATLSSTTYAWYVSNSKATATDITGATASGDIKGNLLLAHNKGGKDAPAAGDYAQTIKFTAGTQGMDLTNAQFDPMTYSFSVNESTETVDKTKFIINADNDGVTGADTASAGWLEMRFWVLSSEATEITYTLTVENTTSSTNFKSQQLFNENGKPTGVALGETFYKDAVQALWMDMTTTKYDVAIDEETGAKTYTANGTATEIGTYSIAEVAKGTDGNAYQMVSTAAAGGDAQTYFKNVVGEESLIAGDTKAATNTSFGSLTLVANVETLVTVRIWLEGRDSDCFDSCINQSFNFTFDFAVKASNNG